MAALLAVLPLQWLNLAQIMGLRLKFAHVGIFALGVMVLLSPAYRLAIARFGHANWQLLLIAAGYIGVLGCSMLWGGMSQPAISLLAKMTTYLVAFVLIGAAVQDTRPDAASAALFWGSAAAVATFVAVATWTFLQVGRWLPAEYLAALAEGNISKLQFGFYLDLFNYTPDGFRDRGAEDWSGAPLRNTLIGSFVVGFVLLQIGKRQVTQAHPGIATAVYWSASLLIALLVVGSLSRSNIIAFGLILLLASIPLLRNFRFSLNSALAVGLVALSATLVLLVHPDFQLWGVVAQRIQEINADPRLGMFQTALSLIDERPLLGYGVGAALPGISKVQAIHNLFLASWYQAGLLGLVASISLYCVVLVTWLGALRRVLKLPHADATRLAWICGLPVLPLVRSLVSGEHGNFTLMEWTALALFLVLVRSALQEDQAPPTSQ